MIEKDFMNKMVTDKAYDALKFIDKFRAFAMRGNVIDMAIGIIIGASFSKIVSSLVKDILMPPLGILMGGINFVRYKIILKEAVFSPAGIKVQEAVTLNIGYFIQVVFDFVIISFALFIVIQLLARAYHGLELGQEKESSEKILKDIRDLLKKKNDL